MQKQATAGDGTADIQVYHNPQSKHKSHVHQYGLLQYNRVLHSKAQQFLRNILQYKDLNNTQIFLA